MKKYYFLLLLIPGLVFLTLFMFIPLFSTIMTTFIDDNNFYFQKYLSFFADEYYLEIFFRTIKLALITTFVAIILGFPTSYYISKVNKSIRGIYIIFAVFPLLTSPVVRSFSWMIILGKKGIINNVLQILNLIDKPLNLLYNEFAIVVGLVYLFLPLMIMSLIGVMENIDKDLVRAAESLGANKFTVFKKIIFPLSIPGLIVGSSLVFTGSLTAYTTPQLLGGSRARVMSTLIYQNAMSLFDWDTASVIATIMILTTLMVIFIINRLAARLNPRR